MRKSVLLVLAAIGASLPLAASAADMRAAPVYTKAPPVMTFTWAGGYIGGYVGGAGADRNARTTDLFSGGAAYNGVPDTFYGLGSSVIGGFTSGYNWQTSNVVFGYETETGYINLRGSRIQNPLGLNDTLASTKVGDLYSAYTLRLGYAWDRSLLYVKGGATVARVRLSTVDADPAGLLINAGRRYYDVGYAVGGGWEYAFDPKWSLKAEYLYLGLDHNKSYSGLANNGLIYTTTTRLPGIHTGKVGLNYKFDIWSIFR